MLFHLIFIITQWESENQEKRENRGFKSFRPLTTTQCVPGPGLQPGTTAFLAAHAASVGLLSSLRRRMNVPQGQEGTKVNGCAANSQRRAGLTLTQSPTCCPHGVLNTLNFIHHCLHDTCIQILSRFINILSKGPGPHYIDRLLHHKGTWEGS